MLRERHLPPPDIFPAEPWALGTRRYDAKLARELRRPGRDDVRAGQRLSRHPRHQDEGRPVREPGVFLNGFYELRPITYGEHAYGFPRVGQSILNCPDGTIVKLFVDGEPFVPAEAEVLSYRRLVDLSVGHPGPRDRLVDACGQRMRLRTLRLVSFDHRHLAAIHYELVPRTRKPRSSSPRRLMHREPLPGDGSDPRLAVGFVGRVLQPAGTRRRRVARDPQLHHPQLRAGLGLRHGPRHRNRLPVHARGTLRGRFRRRRVQAPGRARQADPALEVSGLPLRREDDAARDPRRRSPGRWTVHVERASTRSWSGSRPTSPRFWERADVEVERRRAASCSR